MAPQVVEELTEASELMVEKEEEAVRAAVMAEEIAELAVVATGAAAVMVEAARSTQGSPCTPKSSRTWSPRSKIGQRTTRRKAVAETRAAALGVAGRVGVVPMVKAAAAAGVLTEAWALWE